MIKKLVKKIVGINNVMYIQSFFLPESEKEMMKKRRAFYSQFLKTGDTYYDIGANFGNRIQPIIDMGLKIVAVEPQIECQKYLKCKFGKKISIVPFGLGAAEDVKTMYISDLNTISTFSKDFITSTQKSGRFSRYKWSRERQIRLTTFDKLIKEYGIPRFAKIDVEGFEHEVLKGLTQPIETISIEYAVPEQSDNAVQCLKRICEISGNKIRCNYSIGGSMEWALKEWLTPDQMIAEINSERFIKTGFGDIYFQYK